MSDLFWPEDSVKGLSLLGWSPDGRLTSDDNLMLLDIANEVFKLDSSGSLTVDLIEDRSLAAFDILQFQIMGVDERVRMVSGPYSRSPLINPTVSLIEEATLAFYRGYYTSALATLFIALEKYLRALLSWVPGDPGPTFLQLRNAVHKFPESDDKMAIIALLEGIYARYDALFPPPFYFNRHGLLHGIRDSMKVDQMNCGRMLVLFDRLAMAEIPGQVSRGVVIDEALSERLEVYKNCVRLGREMRLLGR